MTDATMDSPIRAFVALELSDEARAFCSAAIASARTGLGPNVGAIRWVESEGIHLTLKFLGSIPAQRVSAIVDALFRELADQKPFELAVGGLGVFPHPRAPRVIWLALRGNLTEVGLSKARVEAALVPLGFPREQRPFQPHLTLGRVRETATPEQLALIGQLPASWTADARPPFPVTSISLIQSHLGPGGARYTRLAAVPLRAD